MAIKRICKYGEKILKKKTKPVDFKKIKIHLPDIIKNMFDTLDAVNGVGLAANQIGMDLRMAIIKIKNKNDEETKFVLINPEMVEKSEVVIEQEGCLSFPGLFARIKRFNKLKAKALNEKGIPVEIAADGLLARAVQHEIDHLDGILFVEKLPLISRIKLKPVLFKLKKQWAKIDESKNNR
ncbi:MAG: peptide deformylase [Elusimicrobia bacterium]|nr:peptide deformylase [Elusimicrobiota bacterium]